jgi:hypothetical protein
MSAPRRPDEVTVVFGGWSATRVALDLLPGHVIGVNESALALPRCDDLVTMDRLFVENRWDAVRARRMNSWVRRQALRRVGPQAFPWLHVFDCDHGTAEFSAEPGWLNGKHSGACALNRAWQLAPRRVLLVGLDLQCGPSGEPYWHAPHCWRPGGATTPGKYQQWASELRAAALAFRDAGIEVLNCSDRTRARAFPVVAPGELGLAREE